MAWEGYFLYAGQEFINAERTETYARNANAGWFRGCFGSETMGPLLNEVYRTPLLDEAPWTDPDVPESYDFWGVYPLSVTGIEDSTRSAEIIESILDGGRVGRVRHGTRSVVFNTVLVGASGCAVEYGMRWLKRLLLGAACTTSATEACGGDDLCYLSCEPCLDWCGDFLPDTRTNSVNLTTNPSAEITATGGVSANNASLYPITRDTTQPISGTASWMATRTATTPSQEISSINSLNYAPSVVMQAGDTLTVGLDVRPEVGGSNRRLTTYIQWRNGSTDTSRTAVTTYANLVGGVTRRYVVTGTVPAGSDRGHLVLAVRTLTGNAPTGERVWYDRLMVSSNPDDTSGDYFDGNTADSIDYEYAWTGAVNASTSARTMVFKPTPTVMACLDPYMRSLREAVINTGPTVTRKDKMTDGGEAWTVQFTATAGSPWEFGLEVPILEQLGVDPSPYVISPPGVITTLPTVVDDLSCVPAAFVPIFDPSCPASILPPSVPSVPLGCYTPPLNWQRTQFTIPEAYIPLWADVVPRIRITAPTNTGLTDLRLRFYPDVNGDGQISKEDPCSYCGDIVISYIPANEVLVFDGSDELVYIESVGGKRRADSLVYSTDGTPFKWPVLSCGFAYIVAVDMAQGSTLPSIDFSIYPRAV